MDFWTSYVGNKNTIWKEIPGSWITWSIIFISNPHESNKTDVAYTLQYFELSGMDNLLVALIEFRSLLCEQLISKNCTVNRKQNYSYQPQIMSECCVSVLLKFSHLSGDFIVGRTSFLWKCSSYKKMNAELKIQISTFFTLCIVI